MLIDSLLKNFNLTSTRVRRNKLVFLIVIFLLVFIVFTQFKPVAKEKDIKWNYATDNLSPALIQKITSIEDRGKIKFEKIRYIQINNLYLFDYNSSKFCGIGGCLYSLYDNQANLLLNIVDDFKLPKKSDINFIKIIKSVNSKFPCLVFSHVLDQDYLSHNHLKVIHNEYCYLGHRFQRINQTFSEL